MILEALLCMFKYGQMDRSGCTFIPKCMCACRYRNRDGIKNIVFRILSRIKTSKLEFADVKKRVRTDLM